jgi:putative transposase
MQKRGLTDTVSQIPLTRQCELLTLPRSTFYYQESRAQTDRELDWQLMRLLDEPYTRTPFYGSRRMTAWLRSQGFPVNRKRVSRLLHEMRLEAIYPGPGLSSKAAGHRVYPYLLRNLSIERVDQVWSTDITYIRLRRGFVYLVAIIDWFSRYVLGWEISITLEGSFCQELLRHSLRQA